MFRDTCLLAPIFHDWPVCFFSSFFPIPNASKQVCKANWFFPRKTQVFLNPLENRNFWFSGYKEKEEKSPNLIGVGNHLFCCLFLSHRTYNDLIFAFDKNEFYAFFFWLHKIKPEGDVLGKTRIFFVFAFYFLFQEDARTVLRMASDLRLIFDYFFVYNLSLSVIVIQIWRVFDNGIFFSFIFVAYINRVGCISNG